MRKSIRKQMYAAVGIFVLAFAVRYVYLIQMKSSPLFDTPIVDAEYHDLWAQTIASGGNFTEGVFFRAPLYPYFLALVYRVFGHDYFIPRLIQFLIGSLSCVLIYLLGKKIFNSRTALIAGVVAALYGVLIYFEGELLIPVLLVFLDLLLVLAVLWASEKPSYGKWFICGALLGLSALARPNILLVGVGVFLWVLFRLTKKTNVASKSGVYAGCFVLGAILFISPVTLRNYLKGDDFVLIASQGGVNFYVGNNPQSDGVSAVLRGTRTTWWGSYQGARKVADESAGRRLKPSNVSRIWYWWGSYMDARDVAEEWAGKSLKPSEVSRFWYIQGLKFAAEEPLAFLKLTAKKFILLWNGNELSNNRDFYFFARSVPLLKPLIWQFIVYFPFGLIAPLAIVGMILARKEKKEVAILEIFLFLYMLSILLFFVTARYRVPLIPIFILFSAYAMDRLVSHIKHRKFVEFGKYAGILLLACIPINLRIPGYSDLNPGQAHYTLGVVYADKGDVAKAAEEYRKALAYNPNLSEAYVNLGSIYGNQGKHQLALEYYQMALDLEADSAFVLYNIGIEYHNQGLLDQAQENYELSLSIRDDNAKVHYLLGEIYLQKGMVEKAMGEYEKTIKYDPGYALAFYRLGTVFHQMGKREEAIYNLESFVRLWQGEPDQIEEVVKLLDELKQDSEE